MHDKRPDFLLEQTVIPCNRAARTATCAMNVTLKLPDQIVREARHLAIDEKTSLSALVETLLRERIEKKRSRPQKAPNLAESLLLPEEPEWFAKSGFPLLNREVVPLRATPFRFERFPEE